MAYERKSCISGWNVIRKAAKQRICNADAVLIFFPKSPYKRRVCAVCKGFSINLQNHWKFGICGNLRRDEKRKFLLLRFAKEV